MDAELISQASRGDRNAFQLLIEHEYDFIHASAWKWTRNRADAEDIAQDVCIRLASAISKFRGEGRFRTWLYMLVLNAVRDGARKSARERHKVDAWTSEAPLHSMDVDNEQMSELWIAVQQLSDKQRDAVLLVYSEGMDHADAADVLGCSESTVSWHLHAARKRLKIILGREVA